MLIENRTILMTLAIAAVFLAGCGTKSNGPGPERPPAEAFREQSTSGRSRRSISNG
jgi:hypothetical protein